MKSNVLQFDNIEQLKKEKIEEAEQSTRHRHRNKTT